MWRSRSRYGRSSFEQTTTCSQEGCLNQACKGCHSEGPFCCLETVELRLVQGIPHPIIHVTPEELTTEDDSSPTQPDTPAPTSPDLPTQQPSPDNKDAVIREELLELL
ncbi:hypothetical protein E2C01_024015 [Portunus trituberculatus]|uniref:Uncharacterized protein n=1 Tax=Portunus trituberculatus TaxID=210409 RepID=A0A5B7EBK7_PORTR|nr:hypothetical protein [Portunus trituberculatus]